MIHDDADMPDKNNHHSHADFHDATDPFDEQAQESRHEEDGQNEALLEQETRHSSDQEKAPDRLSASHRTALDLKAGRSPVIGLKGQVWQKWASRLCLIIGGLAAAWIFLNGETRKAKEGLPEKQETGVAQQLSAPALVKSDSAGESALTLTADQIDRLKKADEGLFNAKALSTEQEMHDAEVKAAQMRMSASSDVLNVQSSASSAEASDAAAKNNSVLSGDSRKDANTAFMDKASESQVWRVQASQVLHPETMLLQGNIISAVLETRIVSELPGMVRAVTSQDVYSEDNSRVLIPKGSRLIGQYANQIQQGQQRVFVVWQRLIRPDHIDVQLSSPSSDSLGASGIGADNIDHHFFAQFGTAILLSVIGAGTANLGIEESDQYNSTAAYRMALASSVNQTAQQNLQNTGVIAPTLQIHQGTKISVFVARDLDFYSALNVQ